MEGHMPKLHELQERRSTAVSEMRSLNDKVESEKRDYSEAENDKHKKLKTEIAGLDTQISRARDLQEAERAAPAVLHHGRGDRYEQRAREFSLLKAINRQLGEDVDDGLEREISAEVRARSGRTFQGIAVPDEYFHVEKRTLLVGSSALPLYPTQKRDDIFIDKLRASLIVGRLGATVLTDLVGTQDIPRQTGSSTAQWLAEDGALTETDAAFDDVMLTPKTVGAVTSYSRRTLINALPSIEEIVRADLTAIIAEQIDYQALFGSGSGNFPRGVVNAVGVIAETLSAPPTWAQILEFPADIQVANADVGSMGWAMAADAVKKLRSTVKVATTDSAMIMEAPDSLAGYPVQTSTILTMSDTATSSIVIFGAWSQLLVGYWSGVDILVNPFDSAAYLRGRVLMRVMRDVDIAVRHGQSFAWAAMTV
jgi:HK97 family phage major capsid protein